MHTWAQHNLLNSHARIKKKKTEEKKMCALRYKKKLVLGSKYPTEFWCSGDKIELFK